MPFAKRLARCAGRVYARLVFDAGTLAVLAKLRSRLTYANVMATIAIFVALGGSSYAAIQIARNSVLSKHIKNAQVKGPDLARWSVSSVKVKGPLATCSRLRFRSAAIRKQRTGRKRWTARFAGADGVKLVIR